MEKNPRFLQFWPLTATVHAGPNARLRMRPWLTMSRWPGNIDQAARVADKLVDNAVKHGKPLQGGYVHLRVFGLPETDELAIEVEDGLPEFPGFEEAAAQSGEVQGRPKGLWWVAQYRGRLCWGTRVDDDGQIVGKTVQALLPATWDGSV
ncbi:ATP-binding protein [Streptomyces fructofermentans]|uniref:ATP-binding protein n=1 Tax=Streptomyces fructofermentans TaxID=152141 RepID=UPI001677E74C|nr:ATP-binding protein [Streptomyces fructofermentans]